MHIDNALKCVQIVPTFLVRNKKVRLLSGISSWNMETLF